MQVRGDVLPSLDVAVYSQHLERENVLARRTDVFHAALLADLLERDGEQVLFPIGVPAEPRPRIVDVVIRHQHTVEALVDHPADAVMWQSALSRVNTSSNARRQSRIKPLSRSSCSLHGR